MRTRTAGLRAAWVMVALLTWAFVLALVAPASGQPAPGSTEAPASDASSSTATTIPSSSGAPQQAKAGPGDILITQLYEGSISVITTGEVSKTVVSGLTTPTGIATLEDGSILVAENKANRISGIGGRFPDRLTKLAETADPYALGTSPDGAVYVTQLLEGKVSQLDLNSSQLNPVAEGLSRPTAVVGREGDIYVAEAGANKVTKIAKDGTKSDYATTVGTPNGLAFGPDGTMYVSDFVGNRIMKVDKSGTATEFVKVQGPKQLGIDPVNPKTGDSYQIVAAVQSGVIQYKPDATVEARADFGENSAVGVGVVPGGPPPNPTPTVPSGTTPTIVPTTLKVAVPSQDTKVAQPEPTSGNGAAALAVLLLALALIVAVGVAGAVYARRGKRTEEHAGFADLHDSAATMTQAMGPCAAEEVELAEAEDTLRQVIGQRLGAEARLNDANGRLASAERRVTDSRAKAEQLRQQRKGAEVDVPDEVGEDGGPPKLSLAELGLTTEAGRAALQAFGRGELTAVELRERWDELGEHTAVAAVQGQSEKIARTTPWPEEREAALAADQAQLELEQAERDGRDAKADMERLSERERALNERIVVARDSVDACHKRQRHVDEEAATAAASALADLQIAADLAAATGKSKTPVSAKATSAPESTDVDTAEVPAVPPAPPSAPTPAPPPHKGRPKQKPAVAEKAKAPEKSEVEEPEPEKPEPKQPEAKKPEAKKPEAKQPEPEKPTKTVPPAPTALDLFGDDARSDDDTGQIARPSAPPAAPTPEPPAEETPKSKGRGLFGRKKSKDPFADVRSDLDADDGVVLPEPDAKTPSEPAGSSPAGPPPSVKELLDQRRADQSGSPSPATPDK